MSNKRIAISGNVLLLMGPIGTFFGRFAQYLIENNINTYKIDFPLKEYLVPKECKVPFSDDIEKFEDFLRNFIVEKNIKHIFMYGNFVLPHRIAIKIAEENNLDLNVFELGYIRPNYITLEKNVNAQSTLIKGYDFYNSLPSVSDIPKNNSSKRQKYERYMIPAFIQHAFNGYKISDQPHKLQPKLSYLLKQTLGYIRYHIYKLTEYSIRKKMLASKDIFIVPLQVSIDSQVTKASKFGTIETFIESIIKSFSENSPESNTLVFKHHPRDRGYNNYKKFIEKVSKKYKVACRVLYFHDISDLSRLLKNCKGSIMINSTIGIEMLKNNIPTLVLGNAFYNLKGLTYQQSLESFWRNPEAVDQDLFKKFYKYMVDSTQLEGTFHEDFDFSRYFKINL